MNKLFVDSNVLITILQNKQPFFSSCARILSLNSLSNHRLFTTTLALGTSFYYAEKLFNKVGLAKKKVCELASVFNISPCNQTAVDRTVAEIAIHDFEDGLQYFSALDERCTAIITYNIKDYYFSEIPVFTPEDYLIQLLSK